MSLGNVTVKDVGPCKKLLSITVEKSVIQTKIDESYSKLAGSAVIAGYSGKLGQQSAKEPVVPTAVEKAVK